jgi:nitrate/nitrite transporter NarK
MLRNIFQRRFGLTELDASTSAAYLLSGSVFLYPVCGAIVDRVRRGKIVVQLLTVASILTLLCFFWMILPPTLTLTPWPAIVCFGTAMGFAPRKLAQLYQLWQNSDISPVLLVFIVPRIVPLEYVSTTLGLHKSVCTFSSTCVEC